MKMLNKCKKNNYMSTVLYRVNQKTPHTHLFHSDGVNNSKYVTKQWFYLYFKININNIM